MLRLAVHDPNFVAGFLQPAHQVPADEQGTADYEDLHIKIRLMFELPPTRRANRNIRDPDA
jgi:hypothetical protein